MQIRYYGDKISNRIAKTPEGFLICQEVPISRTGFQEYYAGEIMEHPVDAKRIVHVYRPSDEVFDIKSLASFEGKPVTNEHPEEDVTPENYQRYSCGHVQNVRPGMGEDANKVVADLYITDPDLISLILHGKREISCGYYAEEKRDSSGKLCQTKIRGNHVAVVNNGRAGSHVCIRDKKPNFERRFDMKRGKYPFGYSKRSRYDNELFDEDEIIDNELFDEDEIEDNELFDEDIEDNELFDEDIDDNELFDEDIEDNELFDDDDDIEDEDIEDNELFDDEDDITDEDLEDITVDEMFGDEDEKTCDKCGKKDRRRDNELFDEDLEDEDIDDEDIEDNDLFDDEDIEDEDIDDEDLEDCDKTDCRDNDLFDEDFEDEEIDDCGDISVKDMFDDEDDITDEDLEDEDIEDDDEFDLLDVEPDDAIADDEDVEVMETDEVEEKLEKSGTLDTRKDAAMREIISAAAGITNPVERKSVQDAVYRAFCKKSQMNDVMRAVSRNTKHKVDSVRSRTNGTISYQSQQSIYDSFNPHKK